LAGYFLDSSAVAKTSHLETGTEAARALLRMGDVLYISRLTVVEVQSAFVRRVRNGHLAIGDMEVLIERFRSDLHRKTFRTVAVRPGHFRDAGRLVGIYGLNGRLRTLDSIQLAVGLELRKRGLVDTFVCSDKALCDIASNAGFPVFNPETTPPPERSPQSLDKA